MSADRTKPDQKNTSRPLPRTGEQARKAYRSPKLTAYGSIRDLTGNVAAGSKNDGGGTAGMTMMP